MKAGLLLTVAVVLAQTLSQWVDVQFFDSQLRVLDSNHHSSIFGALSILAEAAAAAMIGLRVVSSPRRRAWLLVAALVALLGVVRTLMRYEPTFARHELMILALPLSVVCALVLALTFGDGAYVRSVVWASLLLLGCSFLLHTTGLQADAHGSSPYPTAHSWAYQITGMLKHGAELAGWSLLATAMAAIVVPGCRTRFSRAAMPLASSS